MLALAIDDVDDAILVLPAIISAINPSTSSLRLTCHRIIEAFSQFQEVSPPPTTQTYLLDGASRCKENLKIKGYRKHPRAQGR
jgi:hypothetical protein